MRGFRQYEFDKNIFCHYKEKYLFESKKTYDLLRKYKVAKNTYNIAYYNKGDSCTKECVSKRTKGYKDMMDSKIKYSNQKEVSDKL